MKFIKCITLSFFALLYVNQSLAQTNYGTITAFEILPEYLVNDKIKINSNTTKTQVKCKVSFARTNATTIPQVTWKPFDMTVMLTSYNNSYNIIKISNEIRTQTSDFKDNTAFLKDVVMTFDIEKSKLITGNKILLGFQSPDLPSGAIGGFSKEYQFEIVTPPTVPDNFVHNPFWTPTIIRKSTTTGSWPENGSQPYWYPSSTVPMMTRGDIIFSANGQYVLDFQNGDGNLVLSKVSTGQALWAINKSGGTHLFFEPDGNLIMFNYNNNTMVWTSNIWTTKSTPQVISTHAYFVFQDDGNLVMEWNGVEFTDVIGSTGTGGGVVSNHLGKIKNP